MIDRCNLTVLLEPGQEDLVDFFVRNKVRVVASLPCYSESNVDQQRGRGVFERSIEGLKMLNRAGYGVPGSGLVLDLVYNPGGAFLAPAQAKLEGAYRDELGKAYGIQVRAPALMTSLCMRGVNDSEWEDMRRGGVSECGDCESFPCTLPSHPQFSQLFCLNNMPIKRFADWLVRNGKMDAYMELLVSNFNPAAAEGVMCRCG